ncbi:MAG TPA: 3',5'-cyclic-nucleotide phosphodiesterase [Nitrospiraceae bacterium]|nr:3',5'-cyclic-nucleotide phosphodiesterase [Nitrospiraceae bacterium]
MKIRVLGCHGSGQLVAGPQGPVQCGTCGFLLNETVLVDAGTVGSRLHLEEQRRIRAALLTHLHFDHIRDLPTLADNLIGEIDEPVMVAAIPDVLKGLETHIFNGEVYPDFFRIPDERAPVLRALPLQAGRESVVEGLRVTPIPVNHIVPTVGYIIAQHGRAVLFSGDTCDTDQLWDAAARLPELRAVFIETSFPDDMLELARVSKHLTPALMAKQLEKLGRPRVPVYVYHMKPRFEGRIRAELQCLDIPGLSILEEGQEVVLT